jgi:hypothetical protein
VGLSSAAPGVLVRRAKDPRASKYRRKREPQGDFAEEAADAEMRTADERKWLANRLRSR